MKSKPSLPTSTEEENSSYLDVHTESDPLNSGSFAATEVSFRIEFPKKNSPFGDSFGINFLQKFLNASRQEVLNQESHDLNSNKVYWIYSSGASVVFHATTAYTDIDILSSRVAAGLERARFAQLVMVWLRPRHRLNRMRRMHWASFVALPHPWLATNQDKVKNCIAPAKSLGKCPLKVAKLSSWRSQPPPLSPPVLSRRD